VLLDEEAARRGISRSALVREAVTAYLADAKEATITRRIIDGYRAIPPSVPDAWGEIAVDAEVAADEVAARLDEEERAHGLEPW
jgi:hypothetical protein